MAWEDETVFGGAIVVAAAIAGMEEDVPATFVEAIIWQNEKGKWMAQIDSSEPIQWPDNIGGKPFIHANYTASQLAKRMVTLFPYGKVYRSELTSTGKRIRLA